MALQPDIQYVPFCYVDGSAARKVQRQPQKKVSAAPVPRQRRAKRKVIAVDPVAICGIVIAMVLLVMLLAGYAEYTAVQEKNRQMQDYVTSLQLENAQLQQTFDSNIDLEYVEQVADSLGMVPMENANQIQIEVQLPTQETEQLTLWESISTFLAGLFA